MSYVINYKFVFSFFAPVEYSAHGLISHVSVTGSELGILDGSAFAGLEIQNIQLSRDQLYYISEFAFR